jgi:hypothetical protein
MTDRTGSSIIAAFKKTVSFFEARGFQPVLQHLKHEAYLTLQAFMDVSNIDFQVVSPPMYHHNATERAILHS